MTRLRMATALLAAGAALLAHGAMAQSVNYGDLEQLFDEPVTTSVTGKPQKATEAPASMTIITADDIRRSGSPDLPTILRQYAGLEVTQQSATAFDVGVRGDNLPYRSDLLVLVNGRQVYLDFYGVNAWSALPVQLDEIRQIEVVKGPNSALFGFNAMNGVINIITYNPLYDSVNAATVRGGTPGYGQASAVTTVKLGEIGGLRVSAGSFGADAWRHDAVAVDLPYDHGSSGANFSADSLFQVAPKTQLGLELTHDDSSEPGLLPQNAFVFTHYRTQSYKVHLTNESGLGLIDATVYRNDAAINAAAVSLIPVFNVDNSVTVANLQDLFKVGADHTFRLTGEYRHDYMTVPTTREGEVSYDVLSAGGMWNWQLLPGLSATNALRIDHLSLNRNGSTAIIPFSNADYDNRKITEESFNSGLVWQPTEADTLHLLVARGIRLPSLSDLALAETVPGPRGSPFPKLAASGNPNLEPTISMNYEVGYDRQLPSISSLGRASVFYRTLDNLIGVPPGFPFDLRPPAAPLPTTLFPNIGNSRTVGLELGVDGHAETGWRWASSTRWPRCTTTSPATTASPICITSTCSAARRRTIWTAASATRRVPGRPIFSAPTDPASNCSTASPATRPRSCWCRSATTSPSTRASATGLPTPSRSR